MISKKVRFFVFERDGFCCVYCGRSGAATELHVDHRFPKSRGGSDHPSNLFTACRDCNLGKGAIVLKEGPPVPEALPSRKWPHGIEEPVYFANEQWAVTGYGLECVESYYPIPGHELGFVRLDRHGSRYEWLEHVTDKTWVSAAAFFQAFIRASEVHQIRLDPKTLRATIDRIEKNLAERRDYDELLVMHRLGEGEHPLFAYLCAG